MSFHFPCLDAETFTLNEISIAADNSRRCRALRGSELLTCCIRAGPDELRRFFLAYAVVLHGERFQRTAIRRKVERKTRNIELRVQTTTQYLGRLLGDAPSNWSKEEGKTVMKKVEEQLADALRRIRQDLGLGQCQPSQFTYQVTDDAVAATDCQDLQRKLRQMVTQGDLSDAKFQQLEDFLEGKFPQETSAVLTAVKSTQTREHLSAISLHSIEGKLLVTIVNAQGQRLTLLEHKFRDLLTHPDSTRLLHKYRWQDKKNKDTDFAFSAVVEGMVVGMLNTATCTLEVCRLDEEGRNPQERARFILDLDYLCCLYLVLQRIRDDRERFDRLLEQAEASVGFDPFSEGLPSIFP